MRCLAEHANASQKSRAIPSRATSARSVFRCSRHREKLRGLRLPPFCHAAAFNTRTSAASRELHIRPYLCCSWSRDPGALAADRTGLANSNFPQALRRAGCKRPLLRAAPDSQTSRRYGGVGHVSLSRGRLNDLLQALGQDLSPPLQVRPQPAFMPANLVLRHNESNDGDARNQKQNQTYA